MIRLLLLALLGAGGYLYHARPAGPMDGSVWDVRVRKPSFFAIGRKDTLLFEQGRVTAANSLASGFPSVRYAARPAGEALLWTATSVADTGEAMSWQGSARGDQVEGTVLVTGPDGRATRLNFTGSRRS
ncbi:MAG: hypothetical protein HY554_01300 [Elusimicrobia bacterium]|nr:hypothetical protein [Elusimicrobiota bacterium]